MAARHRAPWVFDVRDLWPDVAVRVGELTDARVIRMTERLERCLYADGDPRRHRQRSLRRAHPGADAERPGRST